MGKAFYVVIETLYGLEWWRREDKTHYLKGEEISKS